MCSRTIYDAEGLRYAVTENRETTNFVYRNGMPVSELDTDKNPLRGYVLGNEYISQVDSTSFGYYLNDEQGSVRYLTGSDGSIRNHYRYSAFGETITAEETVPNRLRYNGQMADGLTGLYYLRARYYNASLGRFTQEDVIYNDGLNLYAYCNSNPVMYCNPSGFAKNPMCDKEDATNKTYYHVTTQQNAEQIIKSGQLKNGKWESYVFAWTQQPTRKEASVAGIGKNYNTVIQFETNASFEKDAGNIGKSIENIVKQTTDAQRVPISIKNA